MKAIILMIGLSNQPQITERQYEWCIATYDRKGEAITDEAREAIIERCAQSLAKKEPK